MNKRVHEPINKNGITKMVIPLQPPVDYFLGYDSELQFIDKLSQLDFDSLFIVTDTIMMKLYATQFIAALKSKFNIQVIVIDLNGEEVKTFSYLDTLCNQLIKRDISKKSILISFGGGALGNIVGMCAGLIFRGIRFIEVPTSTTHMTDATLSNKQAINGRHGKNHFGFYYAPLFIWADTRYLASEPQRLQKAGIIEGVKNALIHSKEYIPYYNEVLHPNGVYSVDELHNLIYNIMQSKIKILEVDPSEKSYSMILEYGHTEAHSIEWLAKGRLIHGEAVSLGMKISAKLAHRLGLISQDDVDMHYHLIDDKLNFKPELPEFITSKMIIDTMENDNKKNGADPQFTLLNGLGSCDIGDGHYMQAIDKAILFEIIDEFLLDYPKHDELCQSHYEDNLEFSTNLHT